MNGITCLTKYFTWRIRNLAHPSPDQKQKWNLEFSAGFLARYGIWKMRACWCTGLMIMAFFVFLNFASLSLLSFRNLEILGWCGWRTVWRGTNYCIIILDEWRVDWEIASTIQIEIDRYWVLARFFCSGERYAAISEPCCMLHSPSAHFTAPKFQTPLWRRFLSLL